MEQRMSIEGFSHPACRALLQRESSNPFVPRWAVMST